MSLHQQLLARQAQNRPIRIALIGAGKFGSMYLAQVPRTPGMHLVGPWASELMHEGYLAVNWEASVAEVAELAPHPDDPAATGLTGRPGVGPEYLISTAVMVPDDTAADVVAQTEARESERARALAVRGNLVRLWGRAPGPEGPGTVGLWRARDPGELMAILDSLPLSGWMMFETIALTPHRDDPVRAV